MADKTGGLKLIDVLEIAKEVLDLLGIAAFVKVFFGGEKGMEKTAEENAKRFAAALHGDYRPKIIAAIKGLQPARGNNLLRRIGEAQKAGAENRLTASLGRIPDDELVEVLAWLDACPDDKFEAMVGVLNHDPFNQFMTRAKECLAGFNADWHVGVESAEHNVKAWRRRQKAKIAAMTPNETAIKVLTWPKRIAKVAIFLTILVVIFIIFLAGKP